MELADFQGSKFESLIDFDNAKFSYVPDLRKTKIDFHFTCDDIKLEFAKNKGDFYKELKQKGKKQAQESESRLRRLKELAASAKDHENEQEFFALELISKKVNQNCLAKIMIYLYEKLSDFGRSILRPVLGLIIAWFIPAFIYCFYNPIKHCLNPHAKGFEEFFVCLNCFINPYSLEFSLAMLLPIIPITKLNIAKNTNALFTNDLPFYLDLLAYFQSFLGITFIFLIGLALRNRFRI